MDLVLIPAYEPDNQLIELVRRLVDNGFSVLTVDDGSGDRYADIFAAVREYATVVTLEHNSGKGAALKAGMRYIRDEMPDCEHFITCDADGQHRVEDVVRVRELLHKGNSFVLTVRNPRKGIPLRSKVGNDLSRVVYALLSNRYLSDNQSGLRGFARSHIDWMVAVEKNNYDYEMNVLYYAAKQGLRIATLPIDAIYIGNNESSHFNPIGDTVKIYRSLFWLARGTFLAFLVAELCVLQASIWFGHQHLTFTIPTAGALAFLTDVLINRLVVFRNQPRFNYWTTPIYTIIWYFLYMLGCMLLTYIEPQLSLFAAFNLVYLFFLPLRYFLHKFTFIASKTQE